MWSSRVFLNHGEPSVTEALAQDIREEFGAKVVLPKIGESYLLES
jgi:predicted metal-dependent RNase